MNIDSRRRRFQQRIDIERQVLTAVNGSLPMIRPLTGITELSVLMWRDDLRKQLKQDDADKISNIIIEIARRCSLDADCSRDVFDGEELVSCDSAGNLLLRLKEVIHITCNLQLEHSKH
jgi:hypothetical protein